MMDDPDLSRHRVLSSVISSICLVQGFKNVEAFALETLTELLKTFLLQLSLQTKHFAELQGRTESNYHDLASSLIELGIDLVSLFKYICKVNIRIPPNTIANPPLIPIPNQPKMLSVAQPRAHPTYIQEHFPAFPEPHTYIQTEVEVNNDKDYQKLRELISAQKLNIEKALVKYKIKSDIKSTTAIVKDDHSDDTSFHVIENKPCIFPYLRAIIPPDDVDLSEDVLDDVAEDCNEEKTMEEDLIDQFNIDSDNAEIIL